jgi:predicted ABC-type ATPase
MPTIYVIAGPNGVGKTTFADKYLPDEAKQVEFVNADLIARGLSPYDPDVVAMDAGRIAIGRIRQLIGDKIGFTWETTMSGRSAAGWLREAKAAGFTLKCYFIWVRQPEITLTRIRQRVVEGGHDIPEAVSRRRFFKTIENFFEMYRPLFDVWKLYENDLPEPRLLAVEKHGRFIVRDRKRLNDILNEANVKL